MLLNMWQQVTLINSCGREPLSETGNAPAKTQQRSYEEWNLGDNGNKQPDDAKYKKCEAQKKQNDLPQG